MASQGVFVAGAPANLTLQVADAQGRQVAVADDAVAHVETWDPSGTELLASEEKPLRHLAGTAYVVQATWAEPALVRVRVESATWGLQPDDRPGVEMLVVSEEEASIYQPDDAPPRDVPALSWAAALAALASVAVLLRTRRR